MSADPDPGREVLVDRRRRSRVQRDEVRHAVAVPAGRRRLALEALLGALVGLVLGGWPAAAAAAVVAVLAQVLWWWVRVGRVLRTGMPVGQTIRVRYDDAGLVVSDATERVAYARGSARVLRYGGNVTVVTPDRAILLPAELLTEDDVAYLEGRVPEGEAGAEPPGPQLPLVCHVTAEVQREMVAAGTSSVVRSADFLAPWVASAFIVVVFVLVAPWPAVLGAAAFGALCVAPGLGGLARTRSRMHATYAPGRVVRAQARPDGLLLALTDRTELVPWDGFDAVRATPQAVLLRRPHRFLGATRVVALPRALFDAQALTLADAGVSRGGPG